MKTINFNSQTLEISDEDFEQLQKKYAKKSGRFEPKSGDKYGCIDRFGNKTRSTWLDDYLDKTNYILGLIFDPTKPFDLERKKARIDLLFEVTKLYHKHVDPLEWKREFRNGCYSPFWNSSCFHYTDWNDYTDHAFAFPQTGRGKAACLAFANEVGIERWKKLCEYGIL